MKNSSLIIVWTLGLVLTASGCTDLKGTIGQPAPNPPEPNGSGGEEVPVDEHPVVLDPVCRYWGGGHQRGPIVLSGSVADINIQQDSGMLIGAVWVDDRIYATAFPKDILEYNPASGHTQVTYLVDWFSADVAEIFPMASIAGSSERLVLSGIHDPINPTQRSTYQLLLPDKIPKLVFSAADNPYITQLAMDCNHIYGLSYHNRVNEVWRYSLTDSIAERILSFELPNLVVGVTVTDDGSGNGELILYSHGGEPGLIFYNKQTMELNGSLPLSVGLGTRMQSVVNDGTTLYAAYQSLADTYVASVDLVDGEVTLLAEGHISSFFPLHLALNGEVGELLLVWRNSALGTNILSSYR